MQVKNKTRARLLLLLPLFCTLCTSLGRVYAAALPEGDGRAESMDDELARSIKEKQKEIASIDARAGGLGDLEEVVGYITIDSDPPSSGGYFFSATMTATYEGIPFSREDSQVIDDGCTYEEVICEPENGRWVVRFTTPEPRVGKVLTVVGLVGVVAAVRAPAAAKEAEAAKVAAAAARAAAEAVPLSPLSAVGAVGAVAAVAAPLAAPLAALLAPLVGTAVEKEAEAAAAEAVAAAAEKAAAEVAGSALLAGVAGAGICALWNLKQEYSPKLEVQYKQRDIHADRLPTLKQKK